MHPSEIPAGFRVAIYARVSSDEQREGQTIDSQVAELERFARDKGWEIVGIYKDDGFSGALLSRPDLDRLRDDAGRGSFDAVVFNDVDRLARDVTHLGVIKRDLERHRVQVIFRKLPAEASPVQNLMVNVLGSFAEFERELIIDRTRRGRRHKIEVRKQFLGCLPPYGFRYVPKDRLAGTDGRLEVNPEEAAVVRKIFAWVADEGLSARKVLARLNSQKVPPRKGQPTWAKSSILRILHSEVYAGVWHYNKFQSTEPPEHDRRQGYRRHLKSVLRQRPRAEWIALELPEQLRLISRQQWQRAQQQLVANSIFSPRYGKHLYVLKGLVRCGGCHGQYVGEPCHRKYYYRCSRRCKRYPMISETILNQTVWQAVEGVILRPEVIADGVARRKAAETMRRAKRGAERAEAEQALRQIEAEEARLLEVYRLGIIGAEHLGRELAKTKNRRNAVTAELASMSNTIGQPSSTDVAKSIHDYCRDASAAMARFDDAGRQRFLRLLHLQCIFTGNIVRLSGKLPIGAKPERSELPHTPADSSGGGIAGTEVDLHGRNTAQEGQCETQVKAFHGRQDRRPVGRPAKPPPTPEIELDVHCEEPQSIRFDLSAHVLPNFWPPQPRDKLGKFLTRADAEGRRRARRLR
ncbi:MAG TPA: recombinase family protein [Candidatus Limnocylindrales bacterium]|nr:recombinase family protein [Candidatus Limnocylindrales bacterium]